ncbi:MAG: LamG domain-containing protein, partial [Planctomycetota bacterium]
AVSMAATDGNDPSGVEYSFICTAGGGHDSGWQDSPVYTDTGLAPDTLYSYRIQLRDKSISANTTALSATGSATTDPDPSSYLVGYWKLDESSGGIAGDDSGNGYSGTLVGDPVWMPAGGWIDGAIDLDGVGDYIRIEAESPFDITDVITVSAWIKVTSFDNDWASVVTKGDSAWRLARSNGGSTMEFSCTGISNNQYGYIAGSINVDDGAWHHVAGVYDGSRIYLYIDGVEDVSEAATGSIDLNNYKVFIGENGQATGRTWNGYIDDVRVYHRALSAPDILSTYQGNL